jgi:hypothetical protein
MEYMSEIVDIWPASELDPVRRMRILVAAMPHAAFRERVLDARFEDVWGVASDLEVGTPRWKNDVTALTVLRREGERLEIEIRSYLGIRLRLQAVLRPAWCLMQGRLLAVGMAATPEGERTRFAHFQVLRVPGSQVLRPLLHHRIHHEFQTLERLAQRYRGV